MPTFNVRNIAPVKSVRDEVFDTRPITTGVNFETGTPLKDVDGSWSIASAPTDLIAGFSLAGTADYAWMFDTFNNVRPKVPAGRSDQEYRGTLLGIWAATDIDGTFAFGTTVVNGKTVFVLDKAAATTAKARVVGVEDGVVVGDVNVPVRFVVIPTERTFTAGGH